MSDATQDQIAEICTAIGMALEEASARMLLAAYAPKAQLHQDLRHLTNELEEIERRIADILDLIETL